MVRVGVAFLAGRHLVLHAVALVQRTDFGMHAVAVLKIRRQHRVDLILDKGPAFNRLFVVLAVGALAVAAAEDA